MDLYVHTIQVLHLVCSVRGTDTFPATANQSLSQIAQPRQFEIPIFPPVESCTWPPPRTMNDDTLMEYSGANNLDPGSRRDFPPATQRSSSGEEEPPRQ